MFVMTHEQAMLGRVACAILPVLKSAARAGKNCTVLVRAKTRKWVFLRGEGRIENGSGWGVGGWQKQVYTIFETPQPTPTSDMGFLDVAVAIARFK